MRRAVALTPVLAAALSVLAAAAAPAKLPYEKRAAEVGASVAEVQFAILHALLDWKGGSNPPYDTYEAKDRALLASVGVSVTAMADPAERVVLDDELAKVRQAHNFGVPDVYNRNHPISFEELVARHHELIARYAGRISLVKPSGAKPPPTHADSPAEQRKRLAWTLVGPLQAMAHAGTDAEFSAALARFNAVAAKIDSGYHLPYHSGQGRRDIYGDAMGIYKKERAGADQSGGVTSSPER